MERVGEHGSNGKNKDTGGRKDAKQEMVPDEDALKAALPGVVKAMTEADEASEKASKKVKAVAKSTGFMADVVRAAAKALMGEEETFEKKKRQVEQLSLAFGKIEFDK